MMQQSRNASLESGDDKLGRDEGSRCGAEEPKVGELCV